MLDARNGIIVDDVDFILTNDLQQQQHDENSSRNLRRNRSVRVEKQEGIRSARKSRGARMLTAHNVVDDRIDRGVEVGQEVGYQRADGDHFDGVRSIQSDGLRLKTPRHISHVLNDITPLTLLVFHIDENVSERAFVDQWRAVRTQTHLNRLNTCTGR